MIAWLPEVAWLPVQALEAVHEVALVLLQVRVELAPAVMLVGLAVRVTVGAVVGGGGGVVELRSSGPMSRKPDARACPSMSIASAKSGLVSTTAFSSDNDPAAPARW